MSYQMLVTFNVDGENIDRFLEIMQMAKSQIASAEGCDSVVLLHSTENPGKVMLSEAWQSKELHDAFAEKMQSAGSLDALARFLVGKPEPELFEIL
ncbi:MAG: antibiotic biosynthesis monooxygenase [Pseudomonadales bacterium]|nr:antibiotic biosynthesis monooxygenase [Pseudomonadales bacterium]